nr:MAG TPA: hypothetical protein [Caudoviricetes sp.]
MVAIAPIYIGEEFLKWNTSICIVVHVALLRQIEVLRENKIQAVKFFLYCLDYWVSQFGYQLVRLNLDFITLAAVLSNAARLT